MAEFLQVYMIIGFVVVTLTYLIASLSRLVRDEPILEKSLTQEILWYLINVFIWPYTIYIIVWVFRNSTR